MATEIELKRPLLVQRLDIGRLATSVPIWAILALQTVASLGLRNTAFQDEALYLYAGRQYFNFLRGGPPVTEPYGQYFAGLPYFYPLLAGIVDSVGGLEAARLLSLGFMLLVTLLVYQMTAFLYNRSSALVAAALFSIQGVVLYLGHFATFDAMCLFLLALATVLAVRADWRSWWFTAAVVGVVLALAIAAKFAALLFTPSVVAILAWQLLRKHGWKQAVLAGTIAGAIAVTGLAVPALVDKNVLIGLTHTTTERVAIIPTSRIAIAERAALLAGGLVLLGGIGLILAGRRGVVVALIFLGSTLLAPGYHIYKTEIVSLQKHVVFSLFFAAPLAGYAVTRISGIGQGTFANRRWIVVLAVCLLAFSIGVQQAGELFREWPNTQALMNVLLTQVRPSGRYLAEEMEVPRYYLQNTVAFWQWNQLYWFYYTDKQGRQLSGVEAYKAAISEGYFNLVILRYGPNVATDYAIESGLKSGEHYELIARIPETTAFGSGNYWVWRRKDEPQPIDNQVAVF
jgi:4-amino-4-deoxy-L-arabinose transferase-like glycosyltransferase